MSYERLGLLSDVEPVLHMHGYSTAECAVLFAIANAENSKLTKQIDAATLDPYTEEGLDAWCRAGAASIAYKKGLTERFVFGALQKLEFDGLIEVRRRTRTRNGVERRSFSWPDWRRLNLPAFRVLERDLPEAELDLDAFLDGAKRRVTPLDYLPLLGPEDASPLQKEHALSLIASVPGWTSSESSVTGYLNRYERDAAMVFLRDALSPQGWTLRPYLEVDGQGKIVPAIWMRLGGPAEDSRPAAFAEMAPWVIDQIEAGLWEIFSETEDGYHFATRYHRDRALEYLPSKLSPLHWTCTPVDAVDSEGVIRPSVKTTPVQDELTACTG